MTETKKKRAPRFKREAENIKSIVLTEQDREIIKLVYKHRFLTSKQLYFLLSLQKEPNKDHLSRRLQALFQGHYLDRPKAQLRLSETPLNQPIIYALGKRGADLLSTELDIPLSKIDWSSKNQESKSLFLEHTLMTNDFLCVIQKACKDTPGLEYIDAETMINNRPRLAPEKTNPLTWPVEIQDGQKKTTFNVIPDGAFGLKITDESGTKTAYFFLEVDRSTMPITRSSSKHSSFRRKMEGYIYTMKNGLFQTNYGIKGARLLTIAISTPRIESMIKENINLDPQKQGWGLFLFTKDTTINLDTPEKVFKNIWINGKKEMVNLLQTSS